MFGLVSKKELDAVREELKEEFDVLLEAQRNIDTVVSDLRTALNRVCSHKVVKEIVERNRWSGREEELFKCTACEFKFDKKLEGSKILRIKEVLSDK